MKKLVIISNEYWDDLADRFRRPCEVPVEVNFPNGNVLYAWSPDGRGAFYYDTLAELEQNHA